MLPVPAAITIDFDPLLHLGALTLRWETVGVTVALLVALTVAALMATDHSVPRWFGGRAPARGDADGPLRLADLVVILVAIVPGAVVGGRLLHGLDYWDLYAADPGRLLDPSTGSLSLFGAVLGGLLSATYIARLIGAPVLRWADAATVPLLLAAGLGKLAQFLGGSGQGLPFDGPWAVAFTGPGPWIAANPAMPAHPSQIYEGAWLLIGIPILLATGGSRHSPLRVDRLVAWADRSAAAGRLFVAGLSWFLVGRVLVGFTWRDEGLVGPLNMEQLAALVALLVIGIVLRARLWVPGYRVAKVLEK
jgi:prolipoprotein diacylglyceryltransferase